MMPFPTLALAKAYIDELRREAQRERLARQAKARNRRDKDHPADSVEAVQPKPFRRWRVAGKTKNALDMASTPRITGASTPTSSHSSREGVNRPKRQRTAQKR